MKIKKNSLAGFTLIEIMIVLFIIVILAGIALASMVRSGDQQKFNNQFESILSKINNARSLAITGKGQPDYIDFDHDGCTDSSKADGANCSTPDYVTPANYGVYFDTMGAENVVLFADMNPKTGGTAEKGKYDPLIELSNGGDLKFGDQVSMGEDFCLITEDSVSKKNSGSIFYSPNYADISFDSNLIVDKDNPFLKIRLHDKTPVGRCRQITIHKLAGIPEVEQCEASDLTESCP